MRYTALWWWIDRWRKSSAYADMTLAEQGAYRNLLDEAHLRGGALPNDERILAKACGDALSWKKVRPAVMARFTLQADGWHNETLDAVIGESKRRSDKQAAYRNAIGNEDSNCGGNEQGKAADNASRPPVPVPVPDLVPNKERKKEPASLSSVSRDPFTDPTITERAGNFVRRYEELYPEYRNGARYVVTPVRDYDAAVSLCSTWKDDARLEKLAICFLTTDHKFAAEGSRTIPQFKALASWADGELSAWEKARA